jgi:Patatin-like phospholipase
MPVTLGAKMISKTSSNAEAQHAAAPGRRKVALALQGGGSHGAFTWGVLDRLLDDETIEITGVTGTSAGAMNGAVLVDGLVRGGPKQACTELRRYWEAVGSMPGFGSYFSNMSGEQAVTTPLENIPAYVETVKKNSSPYDLPPANDNPTRRLLTELIDFDRLRSQQDIQLTVSATNARTARRRVFTNQDVSVDALLASACLPQFFRAVEIDGEPGVTISRRSRYSPWMSAPRRQQRSARRLASRRRKAPPLRRLWTRPEAPTFGCSARLAVMPKSRRRSPASASSSIKCNYGCWTLSHASVRQHLPHRLTAVRQARREVSDGYLTNLHFWKRRGSNSRAQLGGSLWITLLTPRIVASHHPTTAVA